MVLRITEKRERLKGYKQERTMKMEIDEGQRNEERGVVQSRIEGKKVERRSQLPMEGVGQAVRQCRIWRQNSFAKQLARPSLSVTGRPRRGAADHQIGNRTLIMRSCIVILDFIARLDARN